MQSNIIFSTGRCTTEILKTFSTECSLNSVMEIESILFLGKYKNLYMQDFFEILFFCNNSLLGKSLEFGRCQVH